MSVIIGGPKQDEPKEERAGFYVHENLICYLDTQPDGVYVDGKDAKGHLLFRVHKGNVAEAMHYIETKKEMYTDDNDNDQQSRTSDSGSKT